ncbi:MAG TPA: TetR/AcrR family transcriptional regulator [Acidimicrobiales bacterium]|nr:TetR/AcrR family transcriptional regulator [Acidimicrobiales bacterium]
MGGERPSSTEDGGDRPADGRPLRADARRNRERLVEAARKVLADQGPGASMDAIAKQAGVGVGTLYRHFPKRIDVVEAVYRDDVDVLVNAADRGLGDLEAWPALEAWLRGFVDYTRAKRTLLSELHEAFEKNPDLKSVSRERIGAACDRVLRRAQEAGVARDDITGEDLMQLVSPMCMSATLTGDQGDRLVAVILDGLRPSPSAS